jgi:hypothetical protein
MFLGKHLRHKVFIKFVPQNLESKGLQYVQHQPIEDKFNFSPEECQKGGLHFTWLKHASKWSQMGDRVFLVSIPDDALVRLYDTKGKASKIILTEELPYKGLFEREEKVRYLLKRTNHDVCYLMNIPFKELYELAERVHLSLNFSIQFAHRGLDYSKVESIPIEELKLYGSKISKCDHVFKKYGVPYSESFTLTLEQLELYRVLKFFGDFSAIERAKTKKELVKKAYHPTGQPKNELLALSDNELEILALKKEAYLVFKGSKWNDIKDLSIEKIQELITDRKLKAPLIEKILRYISPFKLDNSSVSTSERLEQYDVDSLKLADSNLVVLLRLNNIRRCKFFKYAFLTADQLGRVVIETRLRVQFWGLLGNDKARLREMPLEDLKTFDDRSKDIRTILRYSPPGMTIEKAIAMSTEEFQDHMKQITPVNHDPLDDFFQAHLEITNHPMETVGTTELWELYYRAGPKPRLERSEFLKRCSKYLGRESCRKTISGQRLQRFVGVNLIK